MLLRAFFLLAAASVVSDVDLTTALTSRLAADPYYFPQELSVQAHDGIVTLAGAARNPRAKARAIQDAEATKGVRAVIDRVRVTPPSVPDAQLEKNISSILRLDPTTKNYSVAASVADGVATLWGHLRSKAEVDLAVWVASGVDGVRSVESRIWIPSHLLPSDAELARQVSAKLRRDALLYQSPLEVKAKGGKVFLIGSVSTPAAWHRAGEIAWSVNPGDVSLKGVHVAPSEPGARRTPFHLSDFDIWNAVASSLQDDPRALDPKPAIDVKKGVVTLSGNVRSMVEERAVLQDASNVRGVLAVDDKLAVAPAPGITDEAIAKAILSSIALNSPELLYRVSVSVQGGNAVLTGVVSSAYQKALAADDASRVAGVRSIRNEIRPNPAHPTYLSSELKDDINNAIETDALISPLSQVQVQTRGFHAVLGGSVVSSADRDRACKDAFESGATSVTEDFSIRLESGRILRRGPVPCVIS